MATLALSMTTTVFAGAPAWLWIREALQMTALTYSAFFVFAASRTPDRPASAPFPLDVLVGLVGLYLAAWVLLDSNGTSTPTALTVHRAAGALLTVVAMVWLVQLVRRLPARRSNPPWVGGAVAAGVLMAVAYGLQVRPGWQHTANAAALAAAGWGLVTAVDRSTDEPSTLPDRFETLPIGEIVGAATVLSVVPLTQLAGHLVGQPVNPFLSWLILLVARMAAIGVRSVRLFHTYVQVAGTDPETGALSERGLRRRLDETRPRGEPISVVLLGVDQLPSLAQVLGPEAAASARSAVVAAVAGHEDVAAVARLDDDQIAAVVETGDPEQVAAGLQVTVRSLEPPLGSLLPLEATVRVVPAPELPELLDRSLATGVSWAAPQDDERLRRVRALPAATELGQLRVRYSGMLDATTGRLGGLVAATFWEHPRLGTLTPEEFVFTAADVGLSWSATTFTLRRAIADAAAARAAGLDVQMVVGVPTADLRDEAFADVVASDLDATGLPAPSLVVTVYEVDALLRDARARSTLDRLREMGVHVGAIGFGGNDLTMEHIRTLSLSRISLDPSLVRDQLGDPVRLMLGASAVELAHALGVSVAAVAVDDDDTLQRAWRMGCDKVMGTMVSPRMPFDELLRAIDAGQVPAYGSPVGARSR